MLLLACAGYQLPVTILSIFYYTQTLIYYYYKNMGSMLSSETLFWAPLAMDLMLLVGTYSACKLSGLGWYLDEMQKHTSAKKNDDDDKAIASVVKDESHPIHSVWDLAMTAYSAYGCVSHCLLLPIGFLFTISYNTHIFLIFPSTAIAMGNIRCLYGSDSTCFTVLGDDDTNGCKVGITQCMEVDK